MPSLLSKLSGLQAHVVAAISTLFFWLGVGTLAYRYIEHWGWIKAFYFSVTTLTTVGMGDLYPTTDFSRLFTAIYILLGVGVVLASVSVIGADLLARRNAQILKMRNGKKR